MDSAIGADGGLGSRLRVRKAVGTTADGIAPAIANPHTFHPRIRFSKSSAEGLPGVAFSSEVTIVSLVAQGCLPIGPQRAITRAEGNLLVTLSRRDPTNAKFQMNILGEAVHPMLVRSDTAPR